MLEKKVLTLYFFHKCILITEVYDYFVYSQSLKSGEKILPKITDGKKEQNKIDGDIYFAKHNKNMIMRNVAFSQSEINFGLKTGEKQKKLGYDAERIMDFTINIYEQAIPGILDLQ